MKKESVCHERILKKYLLLKFLKKNIKFLSGSALARTKGKRLADVREVMAARGYVIENKITPLGKEIGIKLQYSQTGDSWIVYPESLNKLL
ncbi:hypothetical protein N9M25_00610 [Schleiferiaceae bacterium]|nr:hypothetical protein [Schleiferiaceae bacterium]